jgi:hypothetical protein
MRVSTSFNRRSGAGLIAVLAVALGACTGPGASPSPSLPAMMEHSPSPSAMMEHSPSPSP